MYVAAARAIAAMTQKDELVPNPLRLEVHRAVARAVGYGAQEDGVARLAIPTDYQLDHLFPALPRR
jgi:malic enzyme